MTYYHDKTPTSPWRVVPRQLSRGADGHLEWSTPWQVWLAAGIGAVLLACGVAALAGPLDACTRTRVQAPHVVSSETRHAADVSIDRVLMFENCEQGVKE